MSNELTRNSGQSDEVIFNIRQEKEMALTKEQLTQWFAAIEKNDNPDLKLSDPDLATQLLSRFGLKDASEVLKFLKTDAGKITFGLISQELMKEEAISKYLAEKNQEALLKQKQALFVVLALMAERSAEAQDVSKLIQEQIQKILKNQKVDSKKTAAPVMSQAAIVQAMLKTYNEAIDALDVQLAELEAHVKDLDEELQHMEAEAQELDNQHAILEVQITELNEVHELINQIKALPRPALYIVEEAQKLEEKQNRIANKKETAQSPEEKEKYAKKLEENAKRLVSYQQVLEREPTFEDVVHLVVQPKLRASPLANWQNAVSHLIQMHRDEKIYLNAELEPVESLQEAYLVVNAHEKDRYVKKDNVYYFLPEDHAHMTRRAWIDAKQAFENKKPLILTPQAQLIEQMQSIQRKKQEQLELKMQRRHLRDFFLEQMSERREAMVNAQNRVIELESILTNPLGMHQSPSIVPVPRPAPLSSYAKMMKPLVKCLAQPQHPEHLAEARRIAHELPPTNRAKLTALIDETQHPEPMADAHWKLSMLNRINKLIPPVPVPMLEEDLSLSKKYK